MVLHHKMVSLQMVSPQNGDTQGGPPPLATPVQWLFIFFGRDPKSCPNSSIKAHVLWLDGFYFPHKWQCGTFWVIFVMLSSVTLTGNWKEMIHGSNKDVSQVRGLGAQPQLPGQGASGSKKCTIYYQNHCKIYGFLTKITYVCQIIFVQIFK